MVEIPFRFFPSFVNAMSPSTFWKEMAGHPRFTHALQPMHLEESIVRGLLYCLNSLLMRIHGPVVMMRDGASFSISSLITFSVSSMFHGLTFLTRSIPRVFPSSTKSILLV